MATNEFWIGANNEKLEHTEWHQIITWHKLADYVKEYLNKGHHIYLEGSIRTREWTDKKGNIKRTVEIFASHIVSLEKPNM